MEEVQPVAANEKENSQEQTYVTPEENCSPYQNTKSETLGQIQLEIYVDKSSTNKTSTSKSKFNRVIQFKRFFNHSLLLLLAVLYIAFNTHKFEEADIDLQNFNFFYGCFIVGYSVFSMISVLQNARLVQFLNCIDTNNNYWRTIMEIFLVTLLLISLYICIQFGADIRENKAMLVLLGGLILMFLSLSFNYIVIAFYLLVTIPVLIYKCCQFSEEEDKIPQKPIKKAILAKLPIFIFNEAIIKTEMDCTICMEKMKTGDKINPLPCSISHCFHESCITEWFKKNGNCPLCSRLMTEELLEGSPRTCEIVHMLAQMDHHS